MRCRAVAATAVSVALLLAGCGSGQQESEDGQSPRPSVVAVDEGFYRAPDLPEPIAQTDLQLPASNVDHEIASARLQILSLDTDGELARLVMAWLPPEQGEPLGSIVLSSHQYRYESTPFVRLVGRETGELIEPLRAESNNFSYDRRPDIQQDDPAPYQAANQGEQDELSRGVCICSLLGDAEEVPPERTELIYLDFPAPEADLVDVVPGEWAEPIRDVPVSSGEPFTRPDSASSWFFTHVSGQEDPPEHYGADARYAATYPVASTSESLSGIVTTIEGETQEVSLPADVLFDFGSAELSSTAQEVIDDVATVLNEEASGETVTVEGHTDNVGDEEFNLDLSEQRALAAREAIEDLLDDSIDLETVGYGLTRPLVPNSDVAGEDLPENRARNRRVSFRYPVVVREPGTEINLGDAGVQDLPEATQVAAAEGAVVSYVIDPPQGDTSEVQVRFDVLDAERDGERVLMRFALASADGGANHGTAFTGHPRRDGSQHFGHNPQGDGNSPGLANMSLIDVGAEQRYFPLSSGDRGCLCTEVAGTVEALPVEPSPMYVEFHLPEELSGPVIVHLPDAGQFTLPDEFVDDLGG